MNNEIGRKITSLTLMTIMVAGGMTFAVPGVMPAAHAANANLFVSAENSQFNNYFGGPMVVEIVINDPDIKDTDEAKGEPDVTINGKIVRMVQATDGLWYAYIADRTMAALADATATTPGFGLDFGILCANTDSDGSTPAAQLFTDAQGYYLGDTAAAAACVPAGGSAGDDDGLASTPALIQENNVVREAKTPNPGSATVGEGQIGITSSTWPIIQVYDLNPTGNVVIQYNKGGNPQTVTLTFDTLDGTLSADLDRTSYPRGSAFHATLTDQALNIDPTDEDSWTFNTTPGNTSISYQLFDESGNNDGACAVAGSTDATGLICVDGGVASATSPDVSGSLDSFLFEDGGVLEITVDAQGVGTPVLAFQDNADQQSNAFTGVAAFDGPVTLLELGPNSGVFANYDELDVSNLVITENALRGTSATLDWDDTGYSAVVGFDFATIDIVPADDEWNSGEIFEVVLNDQDANTNTRFDEDLDLNNPNVELIPSVQIGSPFTLEDLSSAVLTTAAAPVGAGTNDADFFVDGDLDEREEVQAFSQRAMLENEGTNPSGAIASGDTLTLSTTTTYGELYDTLQQITDTSGTTTLEQITNVFNYDLRSILNSGLTDESGSVDSIDVYLSGVPTAAANVGLTSQAAVVAGTIPPAAVVTAITAGDQRIQLNTAGGLTSLQDEFQVDVIPGTAPLTGTAVDADANGIADLLELTSTDTVELIIVANTVTGAPTVDPTTVTPIVADFFSFGFTDDGEDPEERITNMIVRLELEENGDNTGEFVGELEFVMLNQLNILDATTYVGLGTIADDPTFIVSQDFTDEDSVRVNYNDLGADGVTTPIADQEEAPSHSGVVSFDNDSYKIADTVTITLEDLDLNVDSDLIEIYSTVTPSISALVTFTDNGDGIIAAGELSVTRAGNLVQDDTGAAGSGTVTFGNGSVSWTDDNGNGQVQVGELDIDVAGTTATSGTAVIAATANDAAGSAVGATGLPTHNFGSMGNLLNVTFDDELWAAQGATVNGANCNALNFSTFNDGFSSTGFTLVETGPETGVFKGDFQIPENYCTRASGAGAQTTTTGTDIEVNYIDYRDASGEIIEVGDSAGVRANTGSVSLDRTVYPVPFGVPGDFATSSANDPAGRSVFPVHATGVGTSGLTAGTTALSNGDLTIHLRVNDPDWDISATGSDFINRDKADGTGVGPVKISVIRGADSVVLGYAGGAEAQAGHIDVGDDNATTTRDFGPIAETAPDSGIFEADIPVRYSDGPASSICPTTTTYSGLVDGTPAGVIPAVAADGDLADQTDRFDAAATTGEDYCILQGDILQVEYTDPEDASGDVNTVTDSATFDLRNGVLQTDKSVYIIGGDMIMTLIEPDFDLENDEAETYDLDLIEWDSDAATVTMGNLGGNAGLFDPEPTAFRETGDSTGIFQIVIEIPESLSGDNLERGEEIVLEYTDWGPSGSDYVGEEDEDVNVTVYTSNFGATVELDQKVYSWTDKVYITIVAPDHNFDSDLVDEIGNSGLDPIKISTRGSDIDNYKLVETGTDTGIFTGEVILTGFAHDADGDGTDDAPTQTPGTSADGSGPTDGFLGTDDDDGITVSFEFSEDETVVGSALVRWNIGEVQWLEASYPASGTGVVRVIDPDMNLDPEAVDNFDVDVWSDSDAGGIDLTVTETNEATGIFEGTVFFTTFDESSGHRLRVAEGDTVTAEYEDNTLPDPYTTADELDITATSLIGTVVPPLERAPAANLRTVDAFGNSLDTVSVDQQVQISADLANGQDKEQSFAYLVQIQDGNGVTVSLAWITGSLASGQSFSPALSWIPTEAGTYTATAFVWESVDNPTALSPPVSTTVTVN